MNYINDPATRRQLAAVLDEIGGLDRDRESVVERMLQVGQRIEERQAKLRAVEAERIPLCDPGTPERLTALLAEGDVQDSEPTDLEQRLRHNASVDHRIAKLKTDIGLLQDEKHRCAEQITSLAEHHAEREKAFYRLAADALIVEYKAAIKDLVLQCLYPMHAIGLRAGSGHDVNGYPGWAQIVGHAEGTSRQFEWPRRTPMMPDGETYDPDQQCEAFINELRDAAPKRSVKGTQRTGSPTASGSPVISTRLHGPSTSH